MASLAAQATSRPVTGTVTAVAGNGPLQDITVSAAGTNAVTRTNERGQFRINVPTGEVVLVVRGIGYKRVTQRVPATVTNVDFRLEKDILQLEQVTVTGQTTTLETRNATTAVSVVSPQELTRAPAQSLEQALQGKVLGAKIDMNSGAPGGGAQIQIRGVTSVIGNGQPLIVLDGVLLSNESFSSGSNTVTGAGAGLGNAQDAVVNRLADINPNEIESLEILKSAAATALYGSRATNGVVVIRTKRGAAGQSRFNLSQRVGTQNALRRLGSRNFTSTEQIVDLPYGNGESGADYLEEAFPTGVIPGSANIDLEKEFYDNRRPSWQTVGSLTAGNEKTSVFSSATFNREEGLAPNTGANLASGRFNVDQAFTPRLRAALGLNVTRNLARRGISNNDNSAISPIYNFAYTPGVIDLRAKDAQGRYVQNPFNGGGNATSNPFQTFDLLKLSETTWRSNGSGNLSYSVIENSKHRLVANGQGGYDRFQMDGYVLSPGTLQYEGSDGFVGRTTQTNVNSQNYNYSGNLTHTWTPGFVGSFTTNVGSSFEQQGVDLARYSSRDILPGTGGAALGNSPNLRAEGNRTLFRDQALFVTEQILAFQDRLAITGGVRVDRSSANGDRQKWYSWPRASASYRVDTPFIPGMDNVKFRAGWGNTGNRPGFLDRFVLYGVGSIIGGQTSLVRPATVNNPNIRPEKLTETEVGGDFSFFKQRGTFEATYYDRTLTDQLFQAPLAASSGFAQAVVNAGRLRNQGVELGLGVVPVQTRDVTWTSRVNWFRNRQTVDRMPATIPRYNVPGSFGAAFGRNAIVSGNQTTAIFGNAPWSFRTETTNGVTRRIPTEIKPRDYFMTNPGATANTDYIVVDTVIGNSNPKFIANFNNTVSFKRFSVNFTVDWRNGGEVANMTHLLYDEGGNSRDYDNASPIANIPLGQYRYDSWNGGNDTRAYLEKGTNVRLRDLQVSYDAPTALAGRLRARSLRVSLQGRNLWMATDYWGFDPEFNNFGNTNLNRFIDLAPYPGVRNFSLAVDLGF
ncbi:MAG TPA: SusC/RagA family TonB-linked outer membrane protein [Gemmatirosa sp.]|nr:SusC/RagA family TonB-linked outer membrane protein [Gemmatirosa sp.]